MTTASNRPVEAEQSGRRCIVVSIHLLKEASGAAIAGASGWLLIQLHALLRMSALQYDNSPL
jgi:hypothetical protein